MLNIHKPLFVMKIKIQKTDESINYQEMRPDKETSEVLKQDLAKVNPDFFDLAQRFFDCFPAVREIVFNTELTDNE
jgi:hypothetical protein